MVQPDLKQSIALATRLVQQGDLAGAERLLASLGPHENNSDLLYVAGLVWLRRGQFAEAAAAFQRGILLLPGEPRLLFGYGEALAGEGRDNLAIQAYQAAIEAGPRNLAAYYQLGGALQRTGQPQAAEEIYRKLLELAPDYLPAKLALGGLLVDAMRPAEAQALLAQCLNDPGPTRLRAMVCTTHGLALRRQRKDGAALESYKRAGAFDPSLPGLDIHRAEALQNLRRYEEALATYRAALARDPLNVQAHHYYNDLLYRLGSQEYLKSYDRAPRTHPLMLGKAFFLMQGERHCEAHEVYRDVLVLKPGDKIAATGAARALMKMKRYDEAAAAFSGLVANHGGDAAVCSQAAELHLVRGDPRQAMALCKQGLDASPYDQGCLAALSVCLRMTGDERDEDLSGYDSLVGVFDLAPPEGFSSMEQFNIELDAYLDGIHPETREHIGQSLRGGTQTPDHVFRAGHGLIDKLEQRIGQTIESYIASLPRKKDHPFVARRTSGFQYAGSWSSRLKSCGFHLNHIHPEGWISSCYYVAVPHAAKDENDRQGWIKFGEPGFDLTLSNSIRRMVQPVPGRLILFPSYMWHGTVPFQDTATRTTIAFDALPRK
jgi:tetratricopeptide (TPR) repeat protein